MIPSAGVRLGRSVAGKRPLWASWEDMLILIAGPRNLAYAYEAAGNLDHAIPLYEQTLTSRDEVSTRRTLL